MRSWRGRILAVILALSGAWLSGALVEAHLGGGGGLLAKVCGGEGGGGCDQVLDSRWSVFPPAAAAKKPSAGAAEFEAPAFGEEKPHGIPTAALGLCYFVILAVWMAVIGFTTGSRRWMNKVVFAVATIGCLGSLVFILIMATVVKAWCPLCLSSHIVNFLLLGTLYFFRPPAGGSSTSTSGEAGSLLVPSGRLAITTLALALATFFGLWGHYRAAGLASENAVLAAEVMDSSRMEMAYYEIERVAPDIRPDDPTIQAAPGIGMELVYWSDVECPSCANFDRMLFGQILPLYRGHLRVVYKHNPLSIHKNAYKAATALEAARNQGAFWEAHHELLERRAQLGAMDYSALATELGLDAGKFVEDMDSSAVAERIRADVRQLKEKYATQSVPAVVFNKRKLTNTMRAVMGFWKTRVESLQRARENRKQVWGGTEFELADWSHGGVDGEVLTTTGERVVKPAPSVAPAVKPGPVAAVKPVPVTPSPAPSKETGSPLRDASTVFNVRPVLANFGYLNSVNDQRKVGLTFSAKEGAVEVTGVTSPAKFFKATLVTKAVGKEYQVLVETLPPLPEGMINDQIILHTPEGQEDFRLRVVSSGLRPIVVDPKQVRLPSGPLTGEQRKQTIQVSAMGEGVFSIKEASTDLEGVTISVKEVEAERVYSITAEFAEGYTLPADKRFGLIKIQTTHPKMPLLNIGVMQQRVAPGSPAGN